MGRGEPAELSGSAARPHGAAGVVLGVVAIVVAAASIATVAVPAVRTSGLGGLGLLGALVAIVLGIVALRVGSPRGPAGIAGLAGGAVAAVLAIVLLGLGGETVAPGDSPTAAASTRAPSPTPSPTPSWAHPAFSPTTTSGRGSASIPLPAGATSGIVTASFRGAGYFTIVGVDASGTATADSLVELYGSSYSGTTLFGIAATDASLQVRGDGTWTITVAPISSAPELGATASGSGDAVLRLDGAARSWQVSSSGSGLFSLEQRTASGTRLLASSDGPYSGTVTTAAGSTLLVLHASGGWTLTRTSAG